MAKRMVTGSYGMVPARVAVGQGRSGGRTVATVLAGMVLGLTVAVGASVEEDGSGRIGPAQGTNVTYCLPWAACTR